MYRFFVKQEQIDMEEKKIHITGSDVNHIKNVLRMRQGETILISAGDNLEYLSGERDGSRRSNCRYQLCAGSGHGAAVKDLSVSGTSKE